ncbi:methyl-accepting chemotaxis protein [Paucibacter sp. O1-1]|uniref:methyl-accepting chemotaxis protein n=1 Tax=unclassified Roseateles TaxID=2626991 RepID=UPI0010F6238C|nr:MULTISPECIES: methyl-accepting chemotaxis protein [unclassified Roseateles]MCZ7881372.1 methyl-accepting chemotaxis protein [Paucibacter sp. M5-1]MDA3825929.1 methyl-accepting chemotaxis protein [Paucibacter sp. O1-1]MDC6167435.1 methyl-accepting chemotaxis protein [Paucibacter sp. XJ19-41]
MMDLTVWMRSFTIRTRMLGAIAMVLGMFALVGLTGLLGGQRLKSLNADFMEHAVQELTQLSQIRSALADVRLLEKEMVINYEDGVAVLKARESWEAAIKRTSAGLAALQQGEDDADNALAREASALMAEYNKASQPVLAQIQDGGFDTAKVADRMMGRAKTHMSGVEERVSKIAAIIEQEAQDTQVEFNAAMLKISYVFLGVLAVVVLLVVPLTLLNSRTITSPISYARTVAQAIAAGDLYRQIRVEGRDEAAELLGSLNSMQDSLRRLVGQVRESTQHIESASVEVAAGNQDLSERTEQAASNLQSTASSMEQLTGGVRQSADAAMTAKQLATSAAEVAQRGGTVVSEVVSTMDRINQSSRRIGDIIGVIDGIAFQTNILALNAAVEAARAGEQGRGFAVVAGEVRSLAQRSAEAAREIKQLIGASVDQVDAGSQLVQDAGKTMGEIVASVQRVSDIIGEIAAGTSDQSQRIGQVNQAVNQLDQMTQQNAALVEQSAAAAESLREQSQRLGAAVSQFHLDAT